MVNLAGRASLICVVLLVAVGCGGRGSYADENERLLDSLPVYPGSQKVGEDSSLRLSKDDGSPFENNHDGGTETSREFAIPAGSDCAKMMDWFDDQLYRRAWDYASKSGEGGKAEIARTKGSAIDDFYCRDTLVVRVDAHRGS